MSAPSPPHASAAPAPGALAAALIHTSGSLVVGYLLTWGLYGVLAVQVYIYYLAFPNDRTASKILVAVVFLLETLQAVIIARDMFEAFAKGFGNPNAITELHFSGLSAPIIGGVVGFMVQLFYAYRIKVLSKSNIVPALICIMACIQCVGAFISGIRGFIGKDVRNLNTMTDRVGHGLFNATSAACDIVIAIAMSYYLPKLDSGIRKSTHTLVTRIVRLVVGTGSLTAAIAIIDQALFEGFPHKGYFLAPAFILGKLYSNSMMVIFNSRVEFGSLSDSSPVKSGSANIHVPHVAIGRYPGAQNSYHMDTTLNGTVTEVDLEAYPKKMDSNVFGQDSVVSVHKVDKSRR